MRASLFKALPFLAALAGVAAISLLIALLRRWVDVPNLSVTYLLLVLVLGARWGSPPAAAAALLAFLAYDFFFVAPVGTLAVSAPREAGNLVILLGGALIGGQLAASLGAARSRAQAAARVSDTLYRVALEALRVDDADAALRLVCEGATRLAGVGRFSVVAVERGEASVLAGSQLSAEELQSALWSHVNRSPLGLRLVEGRLEPMRSFPEARGPACLPLPGGAVVADLGRGGPLGSELELLTALTSLAGLLLDRRRSAVESERARGLEAADGLKAAVLSSLSHELLSPLASIRLGLTSLSMPEAGLGTEQRDLLNGLDGQAARLDRLVGDLLTLSRLEAGTALELVPGTFPELAGAVLTRLRLELAPYRVEVSVSADLPPVLVDELQIDRVLTNLLQNAIEWTREGGAIGLGAELGAGLLQVWVDNEGPAIGSADLDGIFEKFWTGRAKGTGLGLAICRRVIEAHGGNIHARNLRRGPRFEFTLPLAEVPAEVS